MLTNKNFGSPEEQLRMENELLKIKLMLEHGADFHYPQNDADLVPPEIENEFLKNMEAFENAFHNSEQIKVYDYIGCPNYRDFEDVPADELKVELEDLLELLGQNGINVDTLYDVDDATLFCFITKELFQHEMDNMRMPGWTVHFIYEEFHPNHVEDIKRNSTEFVSNFLGVLEEQLMDPVPTILENAEFLKNFHESFESFEFHYFLIDEVKVEDFLAHVDFQISFTGIIEGSREKQLFEGTGFMKLENIFDFWTVFLLELPKSN